MENVRKENEGKIRNFTPEDAWKRIFTNLGKNKKVIAEQLEKVRTDFPILAETFEYFMGYIGFLRNRIRMREMRFRAGDIPRPEPPDLPSPADLICAVHGENSRECRCARGDLTACGSPGGGGGGISDDLLDFMTCNSLKQNLTEALEKLCRIYQANKDTSDYNQGEFTSIRINVNEISDVLAQLIEQGCFELELIPIYEARSYIELRPI